MMNPFVMRKFAAILSSAFISTVMFFIGFVYYGIIGGLFFMFVGLILVLVLSNILLKNPFTAMLEGKGILAFNMDSTGIIDPFIVKIAQPLIKGKLRGKEIEDTFDRECVHNMSAPMVNPTGATFDEKTGNLQINLDKSAFSGARFAMQQYPVLIYNKNIDSLLTKDFISHKEKTLFAKHGLLYLNRKVEELNSNLRDFGRYVVELTKPKKPIANTTVIIIVIAFILIVLGAIFLPKIIPFLGPMTQAMGGATSGVGNAVITARGG